MITILVILLQLSLLEQPTLGGPCIMDLDISIVHIANDVGNEAEIRPMYHIQRLSDGKIIMSGNNWSNSWLDISDNQGSNCNDHDQSTNFKHTVYELKKFKFDKCPGELQIKTYAVEVENFGPWGKLWDMTENFKCDGKEFKKRQCLGDGGGEVRITCTDLYTSVDQLLPLFIEYVKESLRNDNYDNLVWKHGEFLDQLINGADLISYQEEMSACRTQNNWVLHEFCKIDLFWPIVGVIGQVRNEASPILGDFAIYSSAEYLNRNEWKERTKAKEMIDLMKFVFSKEQLDEKFFTSEMFYMMLHRTNKEDFPENESPFGRRVEQWYQYATNGSDAKLRELFKLKVEQRVKDFCIAETRKSLLCSVVAAKNKYDGTLRYIPQSNPSLISISAYVGDDGLYESFKRNLDTLLQTATITDSVTRLGGQISEYFQTMARFDNAIAKADVGYLTSANEKNGKRLGENAKKLDEIVTEIKKKEKDCFILDILEIATEVAVSVALGIATGGAGFYVNAASMPAKFSKFQKATVKTIEIAKITVETATKIREAADKIKDTVANGNEFYTTTTGVEGAVDKIMKKLEQNSEKIDNMKTIQNAVLDGTNFNTIQKEVDKFLVDYNNYEPAVDLTDLVELNTKQEEMFESMATTFANAGSACKMFIGEGARLKIRQAKAIWTSMYSLLNDIHGKQFELIDALVKVVRSKLDEAAAKKSLASGVNYNFEIIVGYMLSLRVAAQQVCDTFLFMNNDEPDRQCRNMANRVFLSDTTRDNMDMVAKQLQNRLTSYPVSTRYAYIPVSNGSNNRAINWDDLMSGQIIEFALPATDSSFVVSNGWIDFADEPALVKSLQIFIPNNLVPNANKERAIRFNITANQENVVVNGNSNAQRYMVKSYQQNSITTIATYRI